MNKTGKVLLPAGSSEHEQSDEAIAIGPDTLVALDLDRTLVDSDRLVDITLLSLEDGLDADDNTDKLTIAAIERVRTQQKRQKGNSFPYLEALQREIGSNDTAWVNGLAGRVIEANRDSKGDLKSSFINQVMLPEAIGLLHKIDSLGADWLIMTAGQKVTQQYKLALLQQILTACATDIGQISYLIIDPDHRYPKSEMINRSFVDTADRVQFDPVVLSKHSTEAVLASQIASQRYDQIILVDDKVANLGPDDGRNPKFIAVLSQADNDADNPGQTLAQIGDRFKAAS